MIREEYKSGHVKSRRRSRNRFAGGWLAMWSRIRYRSKTGGRLTRSRSMTADSQAGQLLRSRAPSKKPSTAGCRQATPLKEGTHWPLAVDGGQKYDRLSSGRTFAGFSFGAREPRAAGLRLINCRRQKTIVYRTGTYRLFITVCGPPDPRRRTTKNNGLAQRVAAQTGSVENSVENTRRFVLSVAVSAASKALNQHAAILLTLMDT